VEDSIRSFGERIFSFPGFFVLGLALLGLAGYFQRLYASGKKSYDKMWAPVAPTLEAKPSPIDQVVKGWMGCLQAGIALFFLLIALVLAFDAMFNQFAFLFSILDGAR
jgi:hypothetical protein